MNKRPFLCLIGLHGSGHAVSGWNDAGALEMAWRCARCGAIKHRHETGTRIPHDRVPGVRALARETGDAFNLYVDPPKQDREA